MMLKMWTQPKKLIEMCSISLCFCSNCFLFWPFFDDWNAELLWYILLSLYTLGQLRDIREKNYKQKYSKMAKHCFFLIINTIGRLIWQIVFVHFLRLIHNYSSRHLILRESQIKFNGHGSIITHINPFSPHLYAHNNISFVSHFPCISLFNVSSTFFLRLVV